MSLTEGLNRGMVIRHADHLYEIVDFNVVQTGKQKPTVHVKLRALPAGNVVDRSLEQLGKLEEVPTTVRSMQYLYGSGGERVFMDTESFEQYPLRDESISDAIPFLVEGDGYRVQFMEDQPFALRLPDVVAMEVTETAPVEHQGGSSVYKEAQLKSGLMIQVPLFIKAGDRVRVRTSTRAYEGKDH